jgi:hypothetical protein
MDGEEERSRSDGERTPWPRVYNVHSLSVPGRHLSRAVKVWLVDWLDPEL